MNNNSVGDKKISYSFYLRNYYDYVTVMKMIIIQVNPSLCEITRKSLSLFFFYFILFIAFFRSMTGLLQFISLKIPSLRFPSSREIGIWKRLYLLFELLDWCPKIFFFFFVFFLKRRCTLCLFSSSFFVFLSFFNFHSSSAKFNTFFLLLFGLFL